MPADGTQERPDGEIVSARADENGVGFTQIHPDDPPVPATVDPYSDVKVLDDVVREMAKDAHRDGEFIGATRGDDGVVRVETWLDGERHSSSFDREGFVQNGVYHAPPDDAPIPAVPGPHYEGQVVSANIDSYGVVHGEKVVDGEVRGFTVDHEGFSRGPVDATVAQDAPLPIHVELSIGTGDGGGEAHATVIDAHESAHDGSSVVHHDAPGDAGTHGGGDATASGE